VRTETLATRHFPTDGLIVAAGLTPALQQVICLEGLKLGQVNRARVTHWCASGKVVNVGWALHTLGGPSLLLAPLGGDHGRRIAAELAELGAATCWVPCRAHTRVCNTIVDETATVNSELVITELVENANPVEPDEVATFIDTFAKQAAAAALVVLTGSLPSGVAKDFYGQLLRRTSAQAILDVRGEELLAALPCRPLLIKPNREELEHTLGRNVATDADLCAAMRELNDLGAQWVLVTQGGGPVWLTSQRQTFRFQPGKVQMVNSIGCGDCLAAGIAWALRRGDTMIDAVRFGMATAATNAESLLPARFDAAQVAGRLRDVRVVDAQV